MEDVEIFKTEPPDFLCHHLAAGIHIPKDLTIQFLDGSLQVDMIVICAISNLKSLFDEHDHVIVEASVQTGKHLVNIMYTGHEIVKNEEEVVNIQNLFSMLTINIELKLEKTKEVQVSYYEPCSEKTNFTVGFDNNISNLENIPDINSIIMSNMNQNENNIVLNNANLDDSIIIQSNFIRFFC